MLLAVINYDYWENDIGPVLRIFCRNEQMKRIVLDVQDETLKPVFYILKNDINTLNAILKENNVKDYEVKEGIPTYDGLQTFSIFTKYPRNVGDIRRLLGNKEEESSEETTLSYINTYNGDIKWEKKCFQQTGWRQFLEVDDYDRYSFTPLKNIHSTTKSFHVDLNICYWDIETDTRNVKGRQFSNHKLAPKIPIISYVYISSFTKRGVYYAWKPDWTPCVYESVHKTWLTDALKMPAFINYQHEFPITLKLFKSEIDMHKQFVEDFSKEEFDGICTFNGRGGLKVVKGKRKWINGFDMPMFYERCKHLDVNIQPLSPFPYFNGRYEDRNVKARRQQEEGTETRFEIFIKGVPQFDLYFDDNILFYTKYEYRMRRRTLDSFMSHFLSINKVKHGGSVYDLFNEDWNKEMLYNIVDVEGLYALDIYFGYTKDVYFRSILYGGKTEDGVYASKIHDHIYLQKCSEYYVLETRGNDTRGKWKGFIRKKWGGYNHDVQAGIHGYSNDVLLIILDFSKLYPTAVMSVNADVTTKINLASIEISDKIWLIDTFGKRYDFTQCARSPSGFFTKDFECLNTKIYKELIDVAKKVSKERDRYSVISQQEIEEEKKKIYQNMYKIYKVMGDSYKGLRNGKYGSDGMEGGRSYDLVIYNTPPSIGQEVIKFVLYHCLPKLGYKPEFASTDSAICILHTKEGVKEAEELVKNINEMVHEFVMREFNPIHDYINIGWERIFDKMIIIDKRRYVLSTIIKNEGSPIYLKEPEMYYRGFEYVKRDSAEITADMQYKIIDMIFAKKSVDEIIEFIREYDNKFTTLSWSYICGRASISEVIDEGKGQRHDALRNSNKYLDKNYDGSDSPLYAVFDKHPIIFNDHYIPPGPIALAFDENDEFFLKKNGFSIDYDHIKDIHLVNRIDEILYLLTGKYYKDLIYGTDDIHYV